MTKIDRNRYKALSDLHLWEDNYNRNDVARIAISIRRFGFNSVPRLWQGDVVMAGNHSIQGLRLVQQEGARPEIDQQFPPRNVIVEKGEWYVQWVDVSHLDELEATAYAIADNQLARAAVADEPKLAAFLQQIAAYDNLMFEATGFDARLLERMVRDLGSNLDPPPAPDAELDRAAEFQQKWGVEPGQLWLIPSKAAKGEHRLLCGDSRSAEDMQRLCPQKVQGAITSPPYAEQRRATYGGVPADEYVDWWEPLQANVRAALADDGAFFVNIKPHTEDHERVLYVFDLVTAMRRRWEWRFIDEFCWVNGSVPGDYAPRFKNGFEPIYFFAAGEQVKFRPQHVRYEMSDEAKRRTKRAKQRGRGRTYSVTGSGFNRDERTFDDEYALPSNVIEVPHDAGFLRDKLNFHPATFPVGVPEFFLRAYSDPGDVWLDPFAGSGTVLVAAERNQRLACGMERMPAYCALDLERLAGMGLEPQRAD